MRSRTLKRAYGKEKKTSEDKTLGKTCGWEKKEKEPAKVPPKKANLKGRSSAAEETGAFFKGNRS